MPIKPPNQSHKVKEAPNNFTQKRLRERMGPMREYSQDPVSPKSDRELRSPKVNKEQSKIFDTEGFKKAIEDAQKNFNKRMK